MQETEYTKPLPGFAVIENICDKLGHIKHPSSCRLANKFWQQQDMLMGHWMNRHLAYGHYS